MKVLRRGLKKQMIAFMNEFGKSPIEVRDDENIEKAFVNIGFINVWNKIAGLDPETTTRLDLSARDLHRLPRNIGNLSNLTSLDLSRNQVTELPKEIGNLINLESLWLQRNQLTTLSKEVWQCTNLIWLYLQNNQLTTLPKEIGNLKTLTDLALTGNNITSLPLGIFAGLINLMEITLPQLLPQTEINNAGIKSGVDILKW